MQNNNSKKLKRTHREKEQMLQVNIQVKRKRSQNKRDQELTSKLHISSLKVAKVNRLKIIFLSAVKK